MKATAVFIALLFLANVSTSAQKTLTKEEILQDHKASNIRKQLPNDSIKLSWDHELDVKLRYRIVSLKSSAIDSFIVYSVSYPGSVYKIDSCTSKYSTSAYLIWKRQGKVTIEKFKGECHSIIGNNKSEDIFAFYGTHHSQLKDEMFMPIIYSGEINNCNEITYMTSMSFHEPKYSLRYDVNSNYNSFSFGESELTDKKNLFYNYNLDLAAYHLWTLISEQVSK